MAHIMEVYRRFRFSMAVSGELIKAGDQKFGVSRVWSDPFHPDQLWIGCGHKVGEASLFELLKQAEGSHVMVFLHERDSGPTKSITLTYKGVQSLPLDLDAMNDGPALEWIVLLGVKYEDVSTHSRV